jgi:hypothetical protein
MNNSQNLEPDLLETSLHGLSTTVRQLASTYQGDSLKLLALLRTLESLHQEVRETAFQLALPDSRQALYTLLKDIETSGGWPYIHRMKLQFFLSQLQTASDPELALLSEALQGNTDKV